MQSDNHFSELARHLTMDQGILTRPSIYLHNAKDSQSIYNLLIDGQIKYMKGNETLNSTKSTSM